MLRQLLAGVVFLSTLFFVSASFSDNLDDYIHKLIPDECKESAVKDLECLDKNIRKIKSELSMLYQPDYASTFLESMGTKTPAVTLPQLIMRLQDELEKETAKKEDTVKEQKFAGFNWGVALAFTHLGGEKAIKEAKVIGGVVRVTDDYSSSTALMFETHYYFAQRLSKNVHQVLGFGPFVAIRVADSENVNSDIGAYGVGLMLGGAARRPPGFKF